ncbi:hypothetical protein M0804_000968 [Polistes exclamans]|nr:hypothetical protein M0804_000968 [Polistes exclamans]
MQINLLQLLYSYSTIRIASEESVCDLRHNSNWFAVQDPLEQNYLLIHRTDEYYAVPITINNSLSINGQIMNSEKAVIEIKVEPADEYIIPDVPNPLTTKHFE